MKPLSSSLPASLRPAADPVCELCREGHPFFPAKGGAVVHERVGMGMNGELVREVLGTCSNPPAALTRSAPALRPRTESECRAILAEKAGKASAVHVLAEARETYSTLSQPGEMDEEG